ncbi:MAG: nucleotidyltransferase family protein [Xanthomonadales bacterium]|nr:nucleotidyltransferase family protein [Xanthomonadales bacterium]
MSLAVDAGMGPMLHHLIENGQLESDAASAELIEAADMTARVLHRKMVQSVHQCLIELNRAGIIPTTLKGIDVAVRYYPKPHWRLMRDVDLFFESHEIDETMALLGEMGFENPTPEPASRWDSHHHLVPLWNRDMGLWIEVHRGLVPHYSPFIESHLGCAETVSEHSVQGDFCGAKVKQLKPEFMLRYLAAHWYLGLIEDFGEPGLHRALIDVKFLLAGSHLPVLGSLTNDRVGIAIALMLMVLSRSFLIELDPAQVNEDVRKRTTLTGHLGRSLCWIVEHWVCNCRSPRRESVQLLLGDWFRIALENPASRFWPEALMSASKRFIGGINQY